MSQSLMIRFADLAQNAPTPVEFVPDSDFMASAARDLDLNALRKARLTGTIRARGNKDWVLEARLGATVVQPCVVTLEPVTTRIDADMTRHFVHDFAIPEGEEAEMPEDDSVEAIPAELDLAEVFLEVLALNLPLYPRRDGADIAQANFTEPGKIPMTDEDTRPFAGLAALKDQLGGDKSD